MKKPALLAICVLVLIPAAAQARPGALDRSFGHAGRIAETLGPLPGPGHEFTGFAWGRKGEIVAAVGDKLVEYRPDGRRNRGFGQSGVVSIGDGGETPPELTGLETDSRGRILVAGTAGGSVFVARYLPSGRPDPSFGGGGTVITDLGLPPPAPPKNEALVPVPTVTEPVVKATGLAVDATDRPLLTGSWVSSYRDCYPFIAETQISTGYGARLGVDGSVDASFGSGGVFVDSSREVDFSPVADGNDLLFVGAQAECLRGSPTLPRLSKVTERGALDEAFGSGGSTDLPFGETPELTRDRFGRILIVGILDEAAFLSGLLRLRSNGSIDNRFAGSKGVLLPREYLPALAVDARGRPILATSEKEHRESWWSIVSRRLRNGRLDRSFGRGGRVSTHFPGYFSPSQVLIGGSGKILVGGAYSQGGRSGIALARYLSGGS